MSIWFDNISLISNLAKLKLYLNKKFKKNENISPTLILHEDFCIYTSFVNIYLASARTSIWHNNIFHVLPCLFIFGPYWSFTADSGITREIDRPPWRPAVFKISTATDVYWLKCVNYLQKGVPRQNHVLKVSLPHKYLQ